MSRVRRGTPGRVATASLVLGVVAVAGVAFVRPAHADLKQAQALQAAGRIEAAREAYEEVLTHGDNREAMYQLALLSQSGHDYRRYLEQFLEAGGHRDKRAAEVEVRLGRYHYTSGDYHAALDILESARERRTDAGTRVEVRFWLGQTLLALRERDDARRAFEAVINDRAGGPWKSRAIYSLGEILRVSGDPGAAARTFAQLRSDADLGAAAMLAEAQCREKGGDRREAAALYADLLKLRPASGEAAQARAWLAAQSATPLPPPATAATTGGSNGGATGAPATATGAGATATTAARNDTSGPPVRRAEVWRVQVGAFSSIANAQKLAIELEQRGYPEVVAEKGEEPDGLYHVRFGRYGDRQAADKAGQDVSAILGLRYSLVAP